MNGSSSLAKKEKYAARIPWGAIALSFVFFFNPNVSIVDPLPDFIGHIILSLSLVKLSLVCEGLTDARRAFERMILIDGAKLLALLWVFGIEATSERNSSLMLWSFVFGFLEIAFLAPAFVKLFDGFTELGNFHKNTAIHGSSKPGGHSYTDKLKKLSVFLVVFKAVMAFLPELADLTNASYDETSAFIGIYRYIGIMRALCFVPVLAVGIVWLAKALRYVSRIKADKILCESVENTYREKILPKDGIFTVRHVKIATWFFVVAAVLTIDFELDGVNIFPDILVLGFVILSFVYFCKSTKLSFKLPTVMMALYGVSAVLADLADTYYHGRYTYSSMETSSEVFMIYVFYVVAVALKGAIFVGLLAVIFLQLRRVIEGHTGYVRGKEIHSDGEEARILEIHNELSKNFIRVLDVAIVYVLSDILCALYGAFYAFANRNMGWFSIINVACAILFIGMSVRAVSDLREAVQTKYMLE
ncbi:MAG: hypothetical protein J6L85_06700 [Clostridia bacterium]|nr:hypothetical protein [Clostridia bacterium]